MAKVISHLCLHSQNWFVPPAHFHSWFLSQSRHTCKTQEFLLMLIFHFWGQCALSENRLRHIKSNFQEIKANNLIWVPPDPPRRPQACVERDPKRHRPHCASDGDMVTHNPMWRPKGNHQRWSIVLPLHEWWVSFVPGLKDLPSPSALCLPKVPRGKWVLYFYSNFVSVSVLANNFSYFIFHLTWFSISSSGEPTDVGLNTTPSSDFTVRGTT